MGLQAEREPLLSSFLYASILAHPCFERSLGFVLANRLTSATLLATQLMDVFDGVFMTDPYIQQAIRLDVQVKWQMYFLESILHLNHT
jgi:serine O-acetyltransferase